MMPIRREDKVFLKCSKCGYEEEISSGARSGYVDKKAVSEEKRKAIAVDRAEVKAISSEERELMEDYHKQLLENLYETEKESEED